MMRNHWGVNANSPDAELNQQRKKIPLCAIHIQRKCVADACRCANVCTVLISQYANVSVSKTTTPQRAAHIYTLSVCVCISVCFLRACVQTFSNLLIDIETLQQNTQEN